MIKNDEYWKFAESEKHFNDIQAGIRNLASGWMLAAFGAIALLLKTDNDVTWLVSPAVLVSVISFMATLGLVILWINDQLVYQRLLNAGFLVALKVEHDDPTLTPVRTIMRYATENKSMCQWMTRFYTIPMWGFCATSVAATLLRKGIGETSAGVDARKAFWVLVSLCVTQVLLAVWVQNEEREVQMKKRAEAFGNAQFAAMFQGTTEKRRARLAQVIQRYTPAQAAEGGSDT
jgi:hypothetical protein